MRNCTCISTQPSSRLRPTTFGTSRRLVRYITGAGSPSFDLVIVLFTAFPRALPIFSADDVILVLPGADTLDAPLQNRFRRSPIRGRRSSSRWPPLQVALDFRLCGQD